MQKYTERGIAPEGILPGGLNVRRRAHRLADRLNTIGSKDPLAPIDWVTVYAMAVNEENAAGGRVVTAPTVSPRPPSRVIQGVEPAEPEVLPWQGEVARPTEERLHEARLGVAGESLVEKRLCRFVASHHPIEPVVGHLVGDHRLKPARPVVPVSP